MKNNEELRKNFDYYLINHEEIIKEYLDKFVIIKDEKVVDSYDTFEEAVREATKKYELGTFIIQKCSKDLNETTQAFHSRVLIREGKDEF